MGSRDHAMSSAQEKTREQRFQHSAAVWTLQPKECRARVQSKAHILTVVFYRIDTTIVVYQCATAVRADVPAKNGIDQQ